MTTTLLTGVLPTVALNISRGHDDVAIFEIGRVFLPQPDSGPAPIYPVNVPPSDDELAALNAALPRQPHHVGFAMAGDRERAGWWGQGRKANWAGAIDVVRRVAEALHVPVRVEAIQCEPFHPGRCAAIWHNDTLVGYAGELHPRVVSAYGIVARTVAGEFDLDVLIEAAPAVGPKPQFSTFPVAKEDLALIVDEAVPAEDVRSALDEAHDLIEAVRLFDVYTGDQIGPGKKSLAFSIRMRGADHTLTDDEIRSAREAAVAAARAATSATLRV